MSEGDFSKLASKVWEAEELKKKLSQKEKEYDELSKRYSTMEASLKTECQNLRAELAKTQELYQAAEAKFQSTRRELATANKKIEDLQRIVKQYEEKKKGGLGFFKK
jgi:chromosome segregation ATPase